MVDVRKTKLSLIVGFLALILLLIVLWVMRAAVAGDVVARWVLFIIFGAVAVVLASFGIGYVLFLFIEPRAKENHEGKEFTTRRTVKHEPITTWIPVEQLQQTVHVRKEKQQPPARRRFQKKKR